MTSKPERLAAFIDSLPGRLAAPDEALALVIPGDFIDSIAAGAAELMIMGHTHLARHHGPADKASYINTGPGQT